MIFCCLIQLFSYFSSRRFSHSYHLHQVISGKQLLSSWNYYLVERREHSRPSPTPTEDREHRECVYRSCFWLHCLSQIFWKLLTFNTGSDPTMAFSIKIISHRGLCEAVPFCVMTMHLIGNQHLPCALWRLGISVFSCSSISPSTCTAVLFNLFVIVEPLIYFRVCQGTSVNKNLKDTNYL